MISTPIPRLRRRARAIGVLAALALLAACATPPTDPQGRAAFKEANDPIEPFNRSIFEFNLGLDRYLLKPVATAYADTVPGPMRDALRNFLHNLRSPLILANDLLQGEPRRAGLTAERFLLNTTVGFGGLVDVADLALGVGFHDEDFGQTLAVWGAPEGPYLVLPLLGPSNARDAGGYVVDTVGDPVSLALQYYGFGIASIGRFALTALDQRAAAIGTYDQIKDTSIDFYASLRSLYRQRRQEEIKNGRAGPANPATNGTTDDIAPPEAPIAPPPPAPAGDVPVAAAPPSGAPVAIAALPAAVAPVPVPAPPPDPCGGPAALAERTRAAGVIYFANGSSVLTPESRTKLTAIADQARRANATVHVVGHASERTGEFDPVRHRLLNFDVSWLRAAAAGSVIERAGIGWDRLVVEARSDQEPVCIEAMPSGEAANRRVALYLE